MTEERKLDANVLAQFAGSEVLYRHSLLPRVKYTEGVKYVAEEAGAYWLIDEVAFAQRYEAGVAAEAFQLWSLSVTGNTARLVCDDGNGNVLLQKAIDFTDFPEPGIKFYYTAGVLLLPSEY